MRYLDLGHTTAFIYVHVATALVSSITALYLIPLIPCMFSILDESLNKLTKETQESKSHLFTFMAFLCHELRNPLFAITSSAEFLKDTPLNPDQVEEVSSISDSSLLMLRLVNDVLDLSKLDSGKLVLEARQFDLRSLLNRLGENMARQVARKHKGAVQMIFEMTPEVPRVIIGDSCRILQIVYNLLSNSCKFCNTGHIKLSVSLANEAAERKEQAAAQRSGAHTVTISSDRPRSLLSSDSTVETAQQIASSEDEKGLFSMALLDGDALRDLEKAGSGTNPDESTMVLSISVVDTGVGIPSERLKTIFEPYTQAKLSDFRQHGGTGLGLSIISSLVRAMGGNISVTSKEGQGARFHLKIPIRVPKNTALDNNDAHDGARMNFEGEDNQANLDSTHLESRRLPFFGEAASKSIGMPSPASPSTLQLGHNYPPELQENRTSVPVGNTLFSMESSAAANSPISPTLLVALNPPSPPSDMDASHVSTSSRRSGASSSPLPSFDFSPKSNVVLVVDDNSVNRKILGKMLRTYNLEHEIACNGQEAVDILLESRNMTGDTSRPQFGLVFMDVSMPVMDGNTAIEKIRKAKISVPIVALSANVLSQERDRTVSLGADMFHTKPILRNDLHVLCTRFLCKDQQKHAPIKKLPTYRDQMSRSSSTASTESNTSTADAEHPLPNGPRSQVEEYLV